MRYKYFTSLLIATLSIASTLHATMPAIDHVQSPTTLQTVLSPFKLYKNKEGKFLQEFNLNWRAQYVGAWLSSPDGTQAGSDGRTQEFRRFRVGFDTKFLENFAFVYKWNLGGLDSLGKMKNGTWEDHTQTLSNLNTCMLTYNFKKFTLGFGKDNTRMLAVYRTSSATYLTPELPDLETQLINAPAWQITACSHDKKAKFQWSGSLASCTDNSRVGLWTGNATPLILLNSSYGVDGYLLQKGRVSVDLIHNFVDLQDRITQSYSDVYNGTRSRDILALYYNGTEGRFSLMAECLWAIKPMPYLHNKQAYQPNDIFGIIIQPSYMLTDHIEGILSYQYSIGSNAVQINKRYSSLDKSGNHTADFYHSISLGLNYYVFKESHHTMKFMAQVGYGYGEESRNQGNYNAWTCILGAYVNF